MSSAVRTRLYAPQAGERLLILADSDTLDVKRALRLAAGDKVACFNGDGYDYIYQVENSSKRDMHLALERSFVNEADRLPETWVFVAATKGKTKDRIARDLPPLGATRIVFFHAERSVAQPEKHQEERLQKIAIEACRQCERSTVPRVEVTDASLPRILANESNFPNFPKQKIFFWERAEDGTVTPRVGAGPLALIFGPEGGFTAEEVHWMQSQGFMPAGLGKRILRSELAVVVGMTKIQGTRGLI